MNTFKVRSMIDDYWEVYSVIRYDEVNYCDETESHYQGSLSDCEAWIRLTNSDMM
jgi:hypothetical protein